MSKTKYIITPFQLITLAAFFAFFGCENYSKVESASWNVENPQISEDAGGPVDDTEEGYEPGDGLDEVDFGLLRWNYGDFDGSKHVKSGVVISNLKTTKNNFSFKWDKNFSAWGKPAGSHMELCAWFVKTKDGQWIGGKFDWVSNNHSGQIFHHIYPPGQAINYKNWGSLNWGNVPATCEVAFVIFEGGGRRRSNVLKSTWTR